jgi:hypothetical protein
MEEKVQELIKSVEKLLQYARFYYGTQIDNDPALKEVIQNVEHHKEKVLGE